MFGKQKLKSRITYQHTGRTIFAVVLVCAYAIAMSLFAGQVKTADATIPKYINFQGKLTAVSGGGNVTNGTYAFEFKIYDALTSGSLLWTETFDQPSGACGKLTVTNGVFNAKLGSCNALTSVDFTTGSLYMTINFAPTGTSYDGEMSPRKQLVSSAFAFVANGVSGDGVVNTAVQSATALTVGRVTATPALQVDTNTGSSVTGLKVTSNIAASGLALAVISSGTNENLTLDAKGSGTVSINGSATGDVLLAGGSSGTGCTVTNSSGAFACTGAITGSGLSGTNTGDVTLAAFGSSPNANGASLSGQALTLQPADGSNAGGVSTTSQTFAGTKTFNNGIAIASGQAVTGNGGLTVTATAANLAFTTTTSGSITLAPASTGSVQVTSGVTTGTTTSSAISLVANSLTSGTGIDVSSTSLTSGILLNLSSNGTAAAANQTGLNISLQNTNGTSAITSYGAQISNAHAGTTSTNIGLSVSATNGTTANYALIVPASSGNVGFGTSTPSNKLDVIAGTLLSTQNALNVTGTLDTTNTAQTGISISITGAGSGASATQTALATTLNAGYTGSTLTTGGSFTNLSAGTGNDFTATSYNAGAFGQARGTTTGDNVGLQGIARGGDVNVGSNGRATTAKNGATNIGVFGHALNTGTTPIQIGGYFGLQSGKPTFESAALIGDNGSTTDPIFLLRDNGTKVLSVIDGGNVGILDSTPAAALTVGNGDLFQVNSSGAIAAAAGVTSSGTITFSGLSTGGIVTNTAGGVLGTTVSVPVANGGTNCTSASITCFNNITGYTAAGATGTTSTNLVFSTSPTLTTPVLGAATYTTLNGGAITDSALTNTRVTFAGASGLLSDDAGYTFTSSTDQLLLGEAGQSGSLKIYSEDGATDHSTIFQPGTQTQDITYTLPVDDGSSSQFLQSNGSGVLSWQSITTAGLTVGTSTIASGSSGRVLYDNAGVLGEMTTTGTGTQLALSASPTFTGTLTMASPFTLGATSVTTTGTQLNYLNAATGTTGTTSTNLVFSTSPTLVTPTLGAATATTINGNTFTTGTYTLTGTAAKTLTFQNSITLAGTDGTTMTFPGASDTVSGLGATQTYTGIKTFSPTARTSGVASYFTLTTPADTGITANTESIGANFTAGTRTWADGTTTLQRERVFAAPTYNKTTTAATFTTAVNVDIADPIAGTGVTLTNNYSLRAANVLFTGVIKAGSGPTTLTDSAGKILSAALNTVQVAQGGTNCTSATITCFNNITGLSAAGTTGTTSTNLVFSTSPTLVTPVLGAATYTTLNGGAITDSALTSTRVTFASTAGLLFDDAGFTFTAASDQLLLGEAGQSGSLKIYSEDGATDHSTIFQPGTQTQDITYTLPVDDGTGTQYLQTNGSGVLSWTTVASGLTVGSTAIASGSSGRVLYDNGGVLGEMTTTGTGTQLVLSASPTFTGTVTIPSPFTLGATSVTSTGTQLNYLNAATGTTGTTSTNLVFSTSPTLVTPVLGAATYTTLNGGAITDSALTNTRVTFAGASGLLSDDADLTFVTDTLTATKVVAPTSLQTPLINGDTAANGDITINGTSSGTKTTSYVILQDTGGNVGIGTTGPDRKLDVLDASNPQLRLTTTDGSVYSDFQNTANSNVIITGSALASSSAAQYGLQVTPTVNQTSTAYYTALDVNVTETGTTTANGLNRLANFRVGDSSLASISNNGSLTLQNASSLTTAYGGFGKIENHLVRSEEFDNASWTKSSVSAPTANAQTAPDGSGTAESLATSGSGGYVQQDTSTAISSTNYTFSVWVRSTSGTQTFGLRIDGTTTGTGTEFIHTATASWQRFSVTQAVGSFTGNVRVRLYPGTSASTGTVYAWGAQVEKSDTPSNYTKTTSAGITNDSSRGLTVNTNLKNTTASGFLYGERHVTIIDSTTAGTHVGELVRTVDNTALDSGQDVRALEVQAFSGSNVNGINTGIVASGYTFGIQAITTGQAAAQRAPAAVLADLNNGANPTRGNAIEAYSNDATSADLVQFYQETTAFTGAGLLMDFGNNSGSFTGNFLSLKNAGTTKATVSSAGVLAIASVLQAASTTATTYSRLGSASTTHSLSAANDLLVSGLFETDGNAFFDGNVTIAGTCTGCGGGSGITIGTTTITSGSSGRVLYDNAGIVGEMTTTGSGTQLALSAGPTFTGTVTIPSPFTLGATSMTSTGTQLNYLNAATGTTGTTSTNLVFSTSPTLVTPALGAATYTTLNGGAITDSALTNTRVTFAGASGLLSDDSDLTFVTDTLTATKLVAPTSVSTPLIITSSGSLAVTPAATGSVNVTVTSSGKFSVSNSTAASTTGVISATTTTSADFVPSIYSSSTLTATGAITASYGSENLLSSSAVVTGSSVGQILYGQYNSVSKTGADTATGTYNMYGAYNLASNTGRTNVGTVNTYGGYFAATGDTNGTSTAIGLYSTASGADNNYAAIFDQGKVGIGNTTPAATLDITSAATTGSGINLVANSVSSGDAITVTANALTTGHALNISGGSTATGGAGYSLANLIYTASPAGSSSSGYSAITGTVQTAAGSFITNNLMALSGNIINSSSSGSVALARAVQAQIANTGAGTITTAYGFQAQAPGVSAGTIATLHGVHIDNQGTTGVTNAVGLYVDAQSGAATTNYAAIFAGGFVGIGTTAPTAALHVKGGLTVERSDGSGNRFEYNNSADLVEVNSSQQGTEFRMRGTSVTYLLDAQASTNRVGIGVSPGYRFDVYDGTTGQTASNRVANFDNSGATFNTTGGALTSYNGYFSSTSTRSSGANALTNVGLYTEASGAQNNYAAIFGAGNVGIGDTTPAALLTVGSGDLFQVNSSGFIGAQTAPISDYLMSLAGTTGNSNSRIIDITQADTDAESSTGINIVTTSNPGTINGGSQTISSINLQTTPTITLATGGGVNAYGVKNFVDPSGITMTTGATNPFVYGNYNSVTGTPVFNSASTADNYNSAGVLGSVSTAPTLTSVTAGSTFNTTGGDFYNSASSAGSANLTSTAKGVSSTVSGNLTTTGTTTHYGYYADVSGTATTNYGLYINNVTGATTNYSGIFQGGNVGIGDTTPTALLTVGSGDLFQVNSSGAIAAAAGITSSGTITLSGLANAGPQQCVQASTTGVLSVTGSTCGGGLTVGTTTISSGTSTRVLYDNAGVLGEMTTTGTGTQLALSASPTFTGTVTIPTSFVLGATTVTTTGTQLNYLNAATGTTGTTSTNLVFSTSPTLVTPVLGAATYTTLVGGTITPTTDDASDLGDNTHRWRDLYLGGETLHIGTSTSDEAKLSYTTSSNTMLLDNTAAGIINIGTSALAQAITIGNNTANTSLAFTSGGTGSQTFTSAVTTGTTTTSAFAFGANSVTTGTALYAASSTLSSGKLLDLSSNGTAALTNQTGLNIALQGTNGSSSQTTYGAQISNTHGGSGTNIGLYVNTSGGTSNYAAIFNAGNVGIGTTTPTEALQVAGNILIGAQSDATAGSYSLTNSAAGTFGSQTSRTAAFSSAIYNGKLYVATKTTDASGVYRYDGGTTWTLVTSATPGKVITGDTANIDAMVLTVYNGKLYAGTQTGVNTNTGALYSYDGATWSLVNATRGTFATNSNQDGIADLTVYAGQLIIGTQEGAAGGFAAPNDEVDSYSGGTTFTSIGGFSFNVGVNTVSEGVKLAVYRGHLFMSNSYPTSNGSSGSGDLFIYTGDNVTGHNIELVYSFGNFQITSMTVHNDRLFIGTGATDSANIYSFTLDHVGPIEDTDGTGGTAGYANSFTKTTSTTGRIDATNDTTVIDGIGSLREYNGHLYATADTSAGGNLGAVYEFNDSANTWSLIGTRGTFGSQTNVDAVDSLIPFNGTLYIGTEDSGNIGSVYTWTKTSTNAYGLKFDSGSGNYGTISFVGNQTADGNSDNTGNFLFDHSIVSTTGAYDVAEDYATRDQGLQPGDVISLDPNEVGLVKKASGGYDTHVVGVYSEHPGLRLSQEDAGINGLPTVPVALAGRVPVKVTNENGIVMPGDYLTASATLPGYAMKATQSGQIIGQALEGFTNTAPGATGKLLLFVRLGYQSISQSTALQGGNNSNYLQEWKSATGTSLVAINASGKLLFNNDVNLYRSEANMLATDSNLTVGGTLTVRGAASITGNLAVTGNVSIGGTLTVNNATIKNLTATNVTAEKVATKTVTTDTAKVAKTGLAENYPSKDTTLAAGEVVMIDTENIAYVKRADMSTDKTSTQKIVGVIASDAGTTLGTDSSEYAPDKTFPVALAGRTAIKVTAENGAVAPGDFLTASLTVPGAAMRATSAGPIIGQALEGFTGSGNATGNISVFVKATSYAGVAIEQEMTGLAFNYAQDEASVQAAGENSTAILEHLLAQLPNLNTANLSETRADVVIANGELITPTVTAHALRTDLLSAATAQGGLTVASETIFSGGLKVDTIGSVGDFLSFKSDVEFFGTPYFTADTAGFAVVKAGVQSVDITFTHEYLAQPIVSASISFEQDADQTTLSDAERAALKATAVSDAQAFLVDGISYVVTNKSKFGFTIVLNKPATRDIKMSWIALAVRNASTFMSLEGPDNPPAAAVNNPPTTPTTPDQNNGSVAGDSTPVAGDGSSSDTSSAAPDGGVSSTDSGSTNPPADPGA